MRVSDQVHLAGMRSPFAFASSTTGVLPELSPDAISHPMEDRFIGIADYREFLHNPPDTLTPPVGSMMEARYRKTLETRMGLGGGGLMLFRGHLRSDFPPTDPPSPCTNPPSPLVSPRPQLLPCPASGGTPPRGGLVREALFTPPPSPSLGCHTPPRWAARETNSCWTSPASAAMRTPVNGMRGAAVGAAAEELMGLQIGSSLAARGGASVRRTTSAPNLRTPVRHENDLLSTPTLVGGSSNVGASQNGSPVPRRSTLHSQHVTPRRQAETCDRVLNANDISLSDAQGRPNFNPLAWGYMGAVVALQRVVYLWQGPGRVFSLLEVAQSSLVSAVALSRQPTETNEMYLAIGLNNGLIIVSRFTSTNHGPMGFEETQRAVLQHHSAHVSTVQVVGHRLYSGCMGGVLSVRDLRNGSIAWQSADGVTYTESLFTTIESRCVFDCRTDVGAPIYKLEVTPDGEHVAIGTSDSLVVYHTNRLGPSERRRRRVVLTNANRPVRAFCWWGSPLPATPPTTDHGNACAARSVFLNTLLLYGGGVDGSLLCVYSIGSRCMKTSSPLAAPILSISASEVSDEVFVSLDVSQPDTRQSLVVLNNATPNEYGNRETTNVTNLSEELDLFDPSSDEEGPSHVLYVDHHRPVGQSHTRRSETTMTGTPSIYPNITTTTTTTTTITTTAATPTTATTMPTQTMPRRLPNGFGMGTRRALPHLQPPQGPSTTQGEELLQVFQLRGEGTSLEYAHGFIGTYFPSMYVALSPDNTRVATAGSEMKLRFWRAFKAKQSERVDQCDFR